MSPLKTLCLSILLVSLGSLVFAEAPEWSWAGKAGGLYSDYGRAIAADNSGNSYVVGSFTGTINFGSQISLTSYGSQDIFVAKMGATGTWLWAAKAGGPGLDDGISIAVDNNGDAYVTGSYALTNSASTAIFGSYSFAYTNTSYEMFVAKISSSGTWMWAKKMGGMGTDWGQSIAVDSNSNVYVAGAFKVTIVVETTPTSTTLTASGYTDIFIAKLNSSGTWLWAKKAGGLGYDNGNGITADCSGNVYVTGSYNANSLFGTISLTNYTGSSSDVFITKLDTGGNWLWAKKAGGLGSDLAYSTAVDVNGNVYICGSINALANFGATALPYSGSIDGFIAKLDTSGNWLWAQKIVGAGNDYAWSVAADNNSNAFLCGEFIGTATFGPFSLTSTASGYSDGFLAMLSSDGTWQWAKRTQCIGIDATNCVRLDSTGNIYVCGEFTGTTVFNTTSLVSLGSQDVFVAKMGNNPLVLLAPNGGESWITGSTHSVTWAAVGINTVLLDYSLNAGTDWLPITETPIDAGLGTYSWILPDTVCSNVKVRVRDSANSNVFSVSNNVFSIYIPLILHTPNGGVGVSYAANSIQEISWTAVGFSQVLLDYSVNAGNTWIPIITTPVSASPGSYSWTIPAVSSDQVRVRVRDAANPNTFAESSSVFSIYMPLILTSPNGGAGVSYMANTILPVTWNAIGINAIHLDLSLNSGTTWDPILADAIAAGLGTYDWLLPDITNSTVKVRVRDAANSSINAISNDNFAILQPLTLQSPQGGPGVTYAANTVLPIVWNSIGIQQLMLDYSLNSGTTWIPVAANPVPASLGAYDWLLPEVSSDAVKVRISDYTTPATQSISAGLFSIYIPLTLISPNGGVEVAFAANSSQSITWAASGISQVMLDYSLNAGTSWDVITADPIVASLGSFAWTVPDVTCNLAKVRIRDAGNSSIFEMSDSVFSIYIPLLLNSPNGGSGETYVANSILPITWTAVGVASVFLDYSLNGGASWMPILANPIEASLGTYDWTLPGVTCYDVKVRVVDAADQDVFAMSNALFAIRLPLTLLSLNGGAGVNYPANSTQNVLWSAYGIFQVLMDYSLDSGTTWFPILEEPLSADTGEYEWELPEVTEYAVKVRIRDYSNPNTYVVSEQNFAIIIPPSAPEELQVEITLENPNDFRLSWEEVLTDINGSPIQPDGYKIFYCSVMSDDLEDYTLIATVTSGTSYLHESAAHTQGKLFYRVVAYKN